MPRAKAKTEHAYLGEKDIWHPYELQSMKTWKFIMIVNKVLKGEYRVLDTSHCATTIEI
jgi:hypothetical protein